MNKFANSNYGRKILFDKILSQELAAYAFKIDAFYESVSLDQIVSIYVSDDQTIRLGINISFKEEAMFSGCPEPMILSIAFRAYFIVNYLHCLQTAKEEIPNSFFSGLVILDSIGDLLCGKRTEAHIPNVVGTNKHLRPIDVHCAIRAITRVLMDDELSVASESLKACEEFRDILVTYTGTPEIVYSKSKHAKFAVLFEVTALKSLVLQQPNIMNECALFEPVKIDSFNSLDVGQLLSACDKSGNRFWPGLILRMFAIAQSNKALREYIRFDCMRNAYLDFSSNSFDCYVQKKRQSKLLQDNLQAIQQLTRGIEQFAKCDINTTNGMMHYIQ